mgnify:CR=1 FL=1
MTTPGGRASLPLGSHCERIMRGNLSAPHNDNPVLNEYLPKLCVYVIIDKFITKTCFCLIIPVWTIKNG